MKLLVIYPIRCPLCRSRLVGRPKAGRTARYCKPCGSVVIYTRESS